MHIPVFEASAHRKPMRSPLGSQGERTRTFSVWSFARSLHFSQIDRVTACPSVFPIQLVRDADGFMGASDRIKHRALRLFQAKDLFFGGNPLGCKVALQIGCFEKRR